MNPNDLWFEVVNKPRAGAEFRTKLPGVRELLIGPRKILGALARGLFDHVEATTYAGDLALLQVPDDASRRLLQGEELSGYFLHESPECAARPHDASLGEFRTGDGETLLTRRRRADLYGTEPRTPRVNWSLFVSDSHCRLSGIDPDEMIEVQLGRVQRELRDKRVERVLGESADRATKVQVWEAYRRAYLGDDESSPPLLGSLHRVQDSLKIAEKLWFRS